MKKLLLILAVTFALCGPASAQSITANPFPGFGTTAGTAIQGPGVLGAATGTSLGLTGNLTLTSSALVFNTAIGAGIAGPSCWFFGNQLICAGGTSGYAWNNQGNSQTEMSLTNAGLLTIPNVTTGTNADFACFAAGGAFTLQTSACTISSIRFKEKIRVYSASALASIMDLQTYTYRLKATKPANKDPNATMMQLGLTAENVAKTVPLCAIYENDMKTPKSYRQECVIAYLVKGEQELKIANDDLQYQINKFKHRAVRN